MSDFVASEDRGNARWLTMTSVGRMNAVPPSGWDDLADAFESFGESAQRVLVVTGDDGNFCSGADMHKDVADVPSAADNATRMRRTNRACRQIRRCRAVFQRVGTAEGESAVAVCINFEWRCVVQAGPATLFID
jgi:enoyl-CoA hydratase/carnithine racemase